MPSACSPTGDRFLPANFFRVPIIFWNQRWAAQLIVANAELRSGRLAMIKNLHGWQIYYVAKLSRQPLPIRVVLHPAQWHYKYFFADKRLQITGRFWKSADFNFWFCPWVRLLVPWRRPIRTDRLSMSLRPELFGFCLWIYKYASPTGFQKPGSQKHWQTFQSEEAISKRLGGQSYARRSLANRRVRVCHDGAQRTARPTAFGHGRSRHSGRAMRTKIGPFPVRFPVRPGGRFIFCFDSKLWFSWCHKESWHQADA